MATVIKAGALAGDTRSRNCVTFNFEDMSTKANGYLQDVREKAAAILNEAKVEGERLRAQCRAEGRREGEQLARQTAVQELQKNLQTLMPALTQTVAELVAAKAQLLKQWESGALTLAVAMAEKIIRREVSDKPEITLGVLRDTLELAAGAPDITIRLNPDDLTSLAAAVDDVTEQLAHVGKSRVIPDPAVSPGGCRVETAFGEIDQRLESQLTRIAEELAN